MYVYIYVYTYIYIHDSPLQKGGVADSMQGTPPDYHTSTDSLQMWLVFLKYFQSPEKEVSVKEVHFTL